MGKVNINKTGITTPKLVSDEITKTNGEVYITKEEANASFVKPTDTTLSYNWQPALEQKIQFSLLEPYTVPSNGWFVKNADNYTENDTWYISINDRPMFNSDDNGEIFASILVQRGDIITSTSQVERNAYFMPCLSELQDWREESLKADYDIWKNAVLSDGRVVNQYLGSASDNSTSRWNAEHRSTFYDSLHSIKLDEAFDNDNQHLFYIQTENLINGRDMLYGTALASFNGDLSSLTNGRHMFASCFNLESFNSDLSSLTNGTEMFHYCSSLKSFNGDLSSLTDGNYMFSSCSKLESFYSNLSSLTNVNNMFHYCSSLKSFNGDLSSLTNGREMFYLTNLASFTSDLSSLTEGLYMFAATAIKEWNTKLPSLTNGMCMFAYYTNLASFNVDLPSLTSGNSMFYCSSLSSFSGDLPSLTSGNSMFCNTALETFNSDLSSLTDGASMFYYCTVLTSFNSDLSSLTYGYQMFYGTNLASFNSDLSSLTNGDGMFSQCKLDSDSVRRILIGQDADGKDIIGEKSGKLICIPTYESGSHLLGLGISPDSIETFKEITGTTETIPVISDGTESKELAYVDYKGWHIAVNARTSS